MNTLSWLELSRDVELRTSPDGKAYLAEARVSDYGVECAMYQRQSAGALATNADAPFMSKVFDMLGWPNDLSAILCRRTAFPWPLLHWAGLGYLSSAEVSRGLRSGGSRF